MKKRLCKLLVCCVLVFGAGIGLPMRAEEIEELMREMNQPVVEMTVPEASDKDDPLKKLLGLSKK